MPEPIYLDHAATTPVRPEVLEAMAPFYGPRFGNPSSLHRWGREARAALDEARERLANCIGARSDEMCFTSGGTEADNLAILGAWRARRSEGRNAIVSDPIEHKAVLGAVHQAAREGAQERLCRVTRDGVVIHQETIYSDYKKVDGELDIGVAPSASTPAPSASSRTTVWA